MFASLEKEWRRTYAAGLRLDDWEQAQMMLVKYRKCGLAPVWLHLKELSQYSLECGDRSEEGNCGLLGMLVHLM